jgi:putative cardiolipin synthase
VLHAKVLIVDGRRALVGSANLTHRALTANLEAGVLIEDRDLAADLEAHIRSLISVGTLLNAEHSP